MRIRIIGAILALVLAIVGTVVVVLYVRDADIRAANGAELVSVYVVHTTVPQGTPGEEISDYVRVERYVRDAIQPDHVTALRDIAGDVTTVTLLPGDQLVEGRFADPADLAAQGNVVIPDGMQEVTLALPVEQVVGGAVRGGSTVGIVVTVLNDEVGATTGFVLHKVLVTRTQAGDNYVPDPTAQDAAPVATIMVTLALTATDVQRIVWAAELQQNDKAGIWLTLEPEDADETVPGSVTGESFFG
jgi:Flp pilus assembly protein CpaB